MRIHKILCFNSAWHKINVQKILEVLCSVFFFFFFCKLGVTLRILGKVEMYLLVYFGDSVLVTNDHQCKSSKNRYLVIYTIHSLNFTIIYTHHYCLLQLSDSLASYKKFLFKTFLFNALFTASCLRHYCLMPVNTPLLC